MAPALVMANGVRAVPVELTDIALMATWPTLLVLIVVLIVVILRRRYRLMFGHPAPERARPRPRLRRGPQPIGPRDG